MIGTFRRIFFWSSVLAVPLLLVPSSVRAQQCTGQYADDPTYPVLLPKDYAEQGGVAATITVKADNVTAAVWSHRATFTPGTIADFSWTSYNGVSAILYQTLDNDPTRRNQTNVALNGTARWPAFTQGDVGHIWHLWILITDINGQTTLDRNDMAIAAGNGSGIVFQDGLDTNFYQQVITTWGGSSMLTSCQECQAGTTQHCINATHTPYVTISLTNSTSGESQLIQGVQAGNVAHSNESLTGSASLAISVLPGDSGTISIDDKIICSMDGVIFEQTLPKPKTSPTGGSWFPRVTGELAFTKVALTVPTHCTPLLDPNGNVIGLHCDVLYYCSARSSKPDYQPTGLKTYHYTNPALVPPFWMTMAPGAGLIFGPDGSPGQIAVWSFPTADLESVVTGGGGFDPLLLDILTPAWVSDSSTQDCTKWISGITPWYMPKW